MAVKNLDAEGLVDVLNKGFDGTVILNGGLELMSNGLHLMYRGKAMLSNVGETGVEISMNGTTSYCTTLNDGNPLRKVERIHYDVLLPLKRGFIKIKSPIEIKYLTKD